jgi:deoxyribonuclease-4
MSIAGGYYKAAQAAAAFRMDTCQIFTKNNNQWRAKPLSGDDVALFREAVNEAGLRKLCAHSSYLINLGSPSEALWRKSLDAFLVELERAEALGLMGLVIHPGSYVDSTEEQGLERIVKAVDETVAATRGMAVEIWLETTAGQGTNLGWRFEQLRWILEHAADAGQPGMDAPARTQPAGRLGMDAPARTQPVRRLGVCVDTCHLFAAGYPLKSDAEYAETMSQLDAVVGLDRVRAFHLNDSKRELGSRVDRHEHIGLGKLGREPFRHVLNDPRFAELPMYLETPKGTRERDGKEWDAVNMATLRRLVRKSAGK